MVHHLVLLLDAHAVEHCDLLETISKGSRRERQRLNEEDRRCLLGFAVMIECDDDGSSIAFFVRFFFIG